MPTPAKLRLIADLMDSGDPFEVFQRGMKEWESPISIPAFHYLEDKWDVRRKSKPEPKLIPLGPEDVPPGTQIKDATDSSHEPSAVVKRTKERMYYSAVDGRIISCSFKWLMDKGAMINTSLAFGKWNASDWQPCSKPAP